MDKPMDTVLFALRVQELLLENLELENFLAPLAVLLTERLREWNVAGSSLMIVRSRRQPVQVGSEPGFIELERAAHAEDPSRRVLAHQAPAVTRNLDGEDQRSGYWTAACALGMASAAAVPVAVPDPDLAVLTCYSSSSGAFGPAALAAVESAAAELATPLALALRLDAQTHRARNLQAALESRTVVDLAAGIIMAQNNCGQQSAVEILRSVSNSRNVKVRDVAAGVVAVVSDRVSTHFEE